LAHSLTIKTQTKPAKEYNSSSFDLGAFAKKQEEEAKKAALVK
jgi:hypothetical protein